jgi:hypothetical protein
MNNETNKLLDRAAKKLPTESDYSIANALGVSRAAVSKWRLGRNHMADTAAMKLAEILGEPSEVVLALVAADRSSDPGAKKTWTNMAKKLRATAAATTMAALGFTMFPSDAARSQENGEFAQSVYYVKRDGILGSARITATLALATLLQQFLDTHQVLAGSRVLGELGHALTAVEFLDGSDDCLALGFCLRESNDIFKVAIGNIDGSLHDSFLSPFVFLDNAKRNPNRATLFTFSSTASCGFQPST